MAASAADALAAAQHQIEVLEQFVAVLDQVEEGGEGPSFYGRLAEAMCSQSDMHRALVFRYDPGRRRVRVVGSHGIDFEAFAKVPVTIDTADVARQALLDDTVVEARPPFAGRLPDQFLSEADQGPLVCVPLCASGLLIGVVLGQRAPEAAALDDATRHRLWILGKTAALAATARIATYQQGKARALLERIDLARDIHDGVIQRLFGVLLALSASDRDLPAEERVRCAGEVQTALEDLRGLLERPLSRDLRRRTSTLAEELADLQAAGHGFDIRVEGDPAATPPALQALAQEVLGEAVTNIVKHAEPGCVDVRIRAEDGTFVLEVVNDGVRGEPGPGQVGMGLRLAQHAALQAGGLVEYGLAPDGRWQVRLVVAGAA
ncbi:MAG TPA: ATP-binding protein [Baekduia sp.]|nr:ATP-binding protein [Baekduia sp.]